MAAIQSNSFLSMQETLLRKVLGSLLVRSVILANFVTNTCQSPPNLDVV